MCRRTLCTLFTVLALFAGTTWAQSQVRIVRLSYVEGDVQLDRNDSQGFTKAFLNLPIIEGALLSTGADGYAEAELEDGSTVRLVPNSLAEFPELTRDNTGTRTTVALSHGEAFFRWRQNHDDLLRVRSGDQTFTAKKKSHFRLSVASVDSTLAVFDGELEAFRPNGLKLILKKNETLALNTTDLDRYYLTRDLVTDPFDNWDHDRQSDFDRQQHAVYQASAYASLNQYGSYITVPYYGSVWQPAGVGYGWSPYQDGSWVWYPSAGYVWVSSYPWGWAPYRYGSWLFVNNVGWCWRPGDFVNTWNTGPVFVHPPGGYRPPEPPRHQDGVVVVGRPPRDFDDDHRRHPGDNATVVSTSFRPTPAGGTVGSPVVTTSSSPSVDTRPERTRRGDANPSQPIVHTDASARPAPATNAVVGSAPPVTSAPPVSVRPVVIPTYRPERTERLPAQPRVLDAGARTYTPPPTQAPARVEAPRYNPPPPARVAPAPRSEPQRSKADPK